MIDILKQGLVITGIGMGLVFVMIFVLWGIMALLVWITNPKEKKVKKVEVLKKSTKIQPNWMFQALCWLKKRNINAWQLPSP